MRKWELDDDLIYKEASENQAIFIRDDIGMNLLKNTPVFQISTHVSKSCELPVYYIRMKNGVKLILRGNFYDWKMSVETPEPLKPNYLPVDCISYGIKEKISDCYLEGFRKEWCFDKYNPKKPSTKFTIGVSDKYKLYLIIYFLRNAFPDMEFNTSEDKRTVEEIADSICKIYDNYGVTEIHKSDRFGKDEDYYEPWMSAWEILWDCYKLSDDKYRYNKDGNFINWMNDYKIPEKLAKHICQHEDVRKAFLLEEYFYNDSEL